MTLLFVISVCVSFYLGNVRSQGILGFDLLQSSFIGANGNHMSQIIPPGKPWPDSVEGYQNFSILNPQPPSIADRIPEINTIPTLSVRPTLSSRYPEIRPKPPTSSFIGPGGTHNLVSQLIPPGKPWPDSVEGYQNFSILNPQPPSIADRIPEITTIPNLSVKPTLSNRNPEIRPKPPTSSVVGPESLEGFQKISVLQQSPQLADRFPEIVTETARNPNIPTSTTKPTRLPQSSSPVKEDLHPLLHTTEDTGIFTSVPHAPVAKKPPVKVTVLVSVEENISPIRSEITSGQNSYNGDLNNLDFFKPQFQKEPETFLAPHGIGNQKKNREKIEPGGNRKTTTVGQKVYYKPSVVPTTVPVTLAPMVTTKKPLESQNFQNFANPSNLLPPEAQQILSERFQNPSQQEAPHFYHRFPQTLGNVEKQKTVEFFGPFGTIKAEIYIANNHQNYQPFGNPFYYPRKYI